MKILIIVVFIIVIVSLVIYGIIRKGKKGKVSLIFAGIGVICSLIGLFFSPEETRSANRQENNNVSISFFNFGNIVTGGINNSTNNYRELDPIDVEVENTSSNKKTTDEAAYETVSELNIGWGDSSGGRHTYSITEINSGVLGERIVFNSIKVSEADLDTMEASNTVLQDERFFVSARENTGINRGVDNIWNGSVIEAQEGKTYFIRLVVHNNSVYGVDSVACDTQIKFLIKEPVFVTKNDIDIEGYDYQDGYYGQAIFGFIKASNTDPKEYWDGVKFVSERPFHLEYIHGTASMENRGIGAKDKTGQGGYNLSDKVVNDWITIGYDKLNGEIPGCYKYVSYNCITVMPVFD